MGDQVEVIAWNNGKHHSSGAGYGIKFSIVDRDGFFRQEWKSILLSFEESDGVTEVNVAKKSFWDKRCRELIKKEIGIWFRKNDLAPWKSGNPPNLFLEYLGRNRFRLSRTNAK